MLLADFKRESTVTRADWLKFSIGQVNYYCGLKNISNTIKIVQFDERKLFTNVYVNSYLIEKSGNVLHFSTLAKYSHDSYVQLWVPVWSLKLVFHY